MSNELITKLVWDSDEKSRKKALSAISDIEKAYQQTDKAALKGAKGANEYSEELRKLARVDTGSRQRIADINTETTALEKQSLTFGQLAEERRRALDDSFTGSAGNFASQFGGVRGSAEALGLSGVSQPLALAEGVSDAFEFVPQLTASLTSLGDYASQSTGILGTVSSGFQAVIPGMTGTAAGLAAVGLAAAPVVAVAGVLALGFSELQKRGEAVVQAQKQQNALLLEEISARQDARELLAGGDTAGLVDSRAEVQQTVFDLTESIAGLQENITAQTANIEAESSKWNASFIVPDLRRARAETEAELSRLIEQRELETARLGEFDTALSQVSQGELNAVQYREELAAITDELNSIDQTRTQTLAQLEQAQSRVSQFDQQRTQTIEQFAANEERILDDRNIAAQRAEQDRQSRYQEHIAAIEAIEQDGNKRVLALRGELAALPAAREKELQKITTDGNKKLDTINRDYMKKATADAKAFALTQQRTAADAQTAISRLAEDNANRLADAESSNSIVDFLKASSEGATALSRASADAKTEQERAAQDFALRQSEQAEAQKLRIQEAIAGIEAERQKTVESFNEKRAALEQSVTDELTAIDTRTQAEQASFQKSLEQQALQDARRAEDLVREDARRQEAHDAQLARIDELKQAELNRLATIQTAIANLNQQSANLTTQANSATQTTIPPFSVGQSTKIRFGGNTARAYAKGGIIDKPTIALMGESGPEMVLPFKNSPGLLHDFKQAGIGGNNINVAPQITVHLSVGDIATASMVRAEVQAGVESVLYDGIAPLILNALNGVTAA